MNFSTSEFMLGRERCRQWVPLVTQQYRLRHVHQILGFNLLSETSSSYYLTLHLTTMCAPFYTSEHICNPNPRWTELDLKNTLNTSASCIVLRIWQHCNDGADKIILTWGVHFSGLVYIGTKIADIQPVYFKNNAVIFNIQGGYYTSHQLIKTDLQKPVPFLRNSNLVDNLSDNVIYKRITVKSPHSEIQSSYNIDKLRRLHSLQIEIKKRTIEVQNIRDKINVKIGLNFNAEKESSPHPDRSPSSPTCNIRYAPQLLTMNSLNRMLQDKPTRLQRQEMSKITKEIEIAKFKTRLLSQEKDKGTVMIRQLKQKHLKIVEENEEKNSDLMENYHMLSREGERLKEYKRSLLQHREVYSYLHLQLQQRRRRLLEELLFIYPIQKTSETKFTVHGIYLPNSDVLADCSDNGLSVALGYVTHILIMCSTFLQVPLRYPMTHYGSRSYITDNVSPLLPDKDRSFPLYTRGKDKAQFTYAVYLLNKNLAQLRWLFYMNTTDLRATLSNILDFLQGQRVFSCEQLSQLLVLNTKIGPKHDKHGGNKKLPSASPTNLTISDKHVSLHSFGSNSNISDPILDCIRHENQMQRSSSPTQKPAKNPGSKPCRNSECGRGLSEILAIPEAFLNKQISSDSFRNYMMSEKYGSGYSGDGSCCEGYVTKATNMDSSQSTFIKITNGKEVERSCDINSKALNQTNFTNPECIEQGTDPLDPSTNLNSIISRSIKINSDSQLRKNSFEDDVGLTQNKRISRSVGSYTDENNSSLTLRTSFELGSEPLLNISRDSEKRSEDNDIAVLPRSLEEGQHEFLEKWLESTPNLICSNENLYPDEFLGTSSGQIVSQDSPLMARTDALLNTNSFILVKPKP